MTSPQSQALVPAHVDLKRDQLEIEQLRAHISKLIDEREKLGHEVARLKEGSKWTNFGAPVITAVVGATIVALVGALATVTVALLRATTGS